jgi:hypothetical protein
VPVPVVPAPSITTSPSLQVPPSIQAAPSIQATPAPKAVPAPAARAPAAAALVPYCDRFPDQCRPHAHAPHAHAPHDSSQCACEWYDHNGRRWVGGQYARSCCR